MRQKISTFLLSVGFPTFLLGALAIDSEDAMVPTVLCIIGIVLMAAGAIVGNKEADA